MSTIERSCPLVVLLTIVVLLHSCGPEVTQLKTHPSFDHKDLTAEVMGIGGVTSLVETDEAPAIMRQNLSRFLQACIVDKRGNLKLEPAGTMSLVMGEGRYHDILDTYQRTNELTPGVLSEIDSAFQDAVRYLVFARVEDDVIETTTIEDDGESCTEVRCFTSRSVMVSFKIYDLENKICAWGGSISDDISYNNTYFFEKEDVEEESFEEEVVEEGEEREGKPGFLGCCLIGLFVGVDALLSLGGDDSEQVLEYPEPATFHQVLQKVFWSFAETLPEES